jgi:hypothetical protein
VVNELATPGLTAADIKIQIWVAGGEDLAFACPSSRNMEHLSVYAQQSDIAPMAGSAENNAPSEVEEIPSFAPMATIPEDDQYLVYQGERIVSFRSLLKRYNYHSSWFPEEAGGTGQRIIEQSRPYFPYYRGWAADSPDQANNSLAAPVGYSYCNETLLNYLTPAFVGYRGGLRYKAIVTAEGNGQSSNLNVTRGDMVGGSFSTTVRSMTAALPANRRRILLDSSIADTTGSAITPVKQNPVVEWEMPFYTIGQRFLPARFITFLSAVRPNNYKLTIDMDAALEDEKRVDIYVAIAEDFTLGMYVGAPIMYNYTNPVAV